VLFDELRRLRKTIADERSLPAYIVFSDVSLRQMARYYPTTETEFARISGVGEKKLADFGSAFIELIVSYLKKNPRQTFVG
jgi:ATP-dependent DNA helicase RecQ